MGMKPTCHLNDVGVRRNVDDCVYSGSAKTWPERWFAPPGPCSSRATLKKWTPSISVFFAQTDLMADVENGTDETQLPSYLTRHAELGFDSEDIAALIGSIDSSQTAKQSSLPHLPAEILFQILEHVPISYVLSWRLVCRGFRDAIDGPVMLQCLKRMQLIGYLGDRGERPLCPLTDEQYYDIWLVRADFERLEDVTSNQPDSAKWSPAHAVFRIEERWYEHYDSIADHLRVGALVGIGPLQSIIFERLQLLGEQEVHGTLRWCIRLDEAVLDINFPIDASAEYIEIDIDKKMVTIQWKYLLQRFLKVETLFRITMTKVRIYHRRLLRES